eukprot:gene8558-999_t
MLDEHEDSKTFPSVERLAALFVHEFGSDPSESTLQLLQRVFGHSSGPCGKQWGLNQVAFRCLDCQRLDVMALCPECFRSGGHEHHRYVMYISTSGGTCDCGEATAMDSRFFCPKHKSMGNISLERFHEAGRLKPVMDYLKSYLFLALSNDERSVSFLCQVVEMHCIMRDILSLCISEMHEQDKVDWPRAAIDQIIRLDFETQLSTLVLSLIQNKTFKKHFTYRLVDAYKQPGYSRYRENEHVRLTVQVFSNPGENLSMLLERNLTEIFLSNMLDLIIHAMYPSGLLPAGPPFDPSNPGFYRNCIWPIMCDFKDFFCVSPCIVEHFLRNAAASDAFVRLCKHAECADTIERQLQLYVEYEEDPALTHLSVLLGYILQHTGVDGIRHVLTTMLGLNGQSSTKNAVGIMGMWPLALVATRARFRAGMWTRNGEKVFRQFTVMILMQKSTCVVPLFRLFHRTHSPQMLLYRLMITVMDPAETLDQLVQNFFRDTPWVYILNTNDNEPSLLLKEDELDRLAYSSLCNEFQLFLLLLLQPTPIMDGNFQTIVDQHVQAILSTGSYTMQQLKGYAMFDTSTEQYSSLQKGLDEIAEFIPARISHGVMHQGMFKLRSEMFSRMNWAMTAILSDSQEKFRQSVDNYHKHFGLTDTEVSLYHTIDVTRQLDLHCFLTSPALLRLQSRIVCGMLSIKQDACYSPITVGIGLSIIALIAQRTPTECFTQDRITIYQTIFHNLTNISTVPQLRKVLQEDHSLLTMMKDEASSTLKHGTTTATQTDVLMLPSSLSQQRKRALKRRMKLTKRMTKIAGTFSKSNSSDLSHDDKEYSPMNNYSCLGRQQPACVICHGFIKPQQIVCVFAAGVSHVCDQLQQCLRSVSDKDQENSGKINTSKSSDVVCIRKALQICQHYVHPQCVTSSQCPLCQHLTKDMVFVHAMPDSSACPSRLPSCSITTVHMLQRILQNQRGSYDKGCDQDIVLSYPSSQYQSRASSTEPSRLDTRFICELRMQLGDEDAFLHHISKRESGTVITGIANWIAGYSMSKPNPLEIDGCTLVLLLVMGAFKSSEFTENEFQTLCEVIISHALTRELASIGHNIFGATKQSKLLINWESGINQLVNDGVTIARDVELTIAPHSSIQLGEYFIACVFPSQKRVAVCDLKYHTPEKVNLELHQHDKSSSNLNAASVFKDKTEDEHSFIELPIELDVILSGISTNLPSEAISMADSTDGTSVDDEKHKQGPRHLPREHFHNLPTYILQGHLNKFRRVIPSKLFLNILEPVLRKLVVLKCSIFQERLIFPPMTDKSMTCIDLYCRFLRFDFTVFSEHFKQDGMWELCNLAMLKCGNFIREWINQMATDATCQYQQISNFDFRNLSSSCDPSISTVKPSLIAMPNTFEQFYRTYCEEKIGSEDIRTVSVCLFCSSLVLRSNTRDIDHPTHLQTDVEHAELCSGIMMRAICPVVEIVQDGRRHIWGTFFLDEFDEEDMQMSRGHKLELNNQRYELLQQDWLRHRLLPPITSR